MILDESSVDILSEGSESAIGNEIITEALIQDALLEEGMSPILDEDTIAYLISENLLSERNILKWDKKAKRKHATNKAAIVIAREKGDKDYKKLVTVYKLRKKLLDRIMAKYGNKAKIRAKQQESNHGVAKVIAKIKDNVHVKKSDMDKPARKA